MNKEKYSFNFNGFAHGKKTIIMIRDVSLPMMKQSEDSSTNIYEFIRHYYVTMGWYLSDSDKHYVFKNMILAATMNYNHPLPISLSKYFITINRPLSEDDLHTIVKELTQPVFSLVPSIH